METNYDKTVDHFGATRIDGTVLDRLRKIAGGSLHPFLESGLFYCHKDLEPILDCYDRGEPFYLYTGRGPSSESIHLGHLIPFQMTAYLQSIFKVPVIIQITDDEKFLSRDLDWDRVSRFTEENIKDINCVGLDPDNTYLFRNTEYIGRLYPNILRLEKKVRLGQLLNIFGGTKSDPIGQIRFPISQMAPCFPTSFDFLDKRARCLVVAAVDQDPYFRHIRNIAHSLGEKRPSLIYSGYLPSLRGPSDPKMSSSVRNSVIFLNDSNKQIKKKINTAFSGGRETVEEHRELGGIPEVDTAFNCLRIFHPDRELVQRVEEEFRSGRMLSGELKKLAIQLVTKMVGTHTEARKSLEAGDRRTIHRLHH